MADSQIDLRFHTFTMGFFGAGGAGKTTFITRYRTGEFEKRYFPTDMVKGNNLTFYTTEGKVIIRCVDTAGQLLYEPQYMPKVKVAVVMFDVCSRLSFRSVDDWVERIRKVNGEIPILLCGNKVDVVRRKASAAEIREKMTNLRISTMYSISAKSNYNFEKPFLWAIRTMLGVCDCQFVEAPAIQG